MQSDWTIYIKVCLCNSSNIRVILFFVVLKFVISINLMHVLIL